MFLENTTKFVPWVIGQATSLSIQHLGPMPDGGWPLPELLEYFVGFDVMINNLPPGDGRGKIRLWVWVDAPGKRFHTR